MQTRRPMSEEEFARYQRICSALGIRDFSNLLIHYTSVAALDAILTSGELWFGKLADLKDTAECDHFVDGVLKNASRLIPMADPRVIAQVLQQYRDMMKNDTYVSSWCEYSTAEPEGSLLMWREFGDDGDGVGLVIDSSQFLASAIKREHLAFGVLSARMDYVHKDRATDFANDMFTRLANVEFVGADVPKIIGVAAVLLSKAP